MELKKPLEPRKFDLDLVLQTLQGEWEDNVGRTIEVDGDEATFNDGTGPWSIRTEDGSLVLRGASLVIDALDNGKVSDADAQPAWRYPTGAELIWSRPSPVAEEDVKWSEMFHSYKHRVLAKRKSLWAALAAEDYLQAAKIRDEPLEEAALTGASPEHHFRLMAGRGLAPGVCFTHRTSGVRGVIVCAEPWYNAPLARRLDGKGSVEMKLQPFYHCLIDERNTYEQGGAMVMNDGGEETGAAAFLKEEEILEDPDAFPVKNALVSRLFVHADELQGYLPGPLLSEALKNHLEGAPFAV